MDICKSFDCIVNAQLSPVTKKVYLERLRYIINDTQVELNEILINPDKYLKWVEEHSSTPQTQKSYISAILAVFKHTPGLKDKYRQHYYKWYEGFKKNHNSIDENYKHNKPSEKQKEGYVEYKDIIKKRDSLLEGSKERLLLSLYTYLPPLRSDFNKIYIYEKEPKTYEYDNYITLFEDKPKLVLQEYKTAKTNEIYEKELPDELVKEIKISLKNNPREWLFMDRTKNYYRSSSFTKWINRTLKKLFGKPLTISLIRHSYINQLDFNKLTVKQKEDIANDMRHTTNTQDRYRLIFN